MIFETIRSLQMEPCVLYVGTVKRRNIGFDIRQMEMEDGETYDKAKQRVVAARSKTSWTVTRHCSIILLRVASTCA